MSFVTLPMSSLLYFDQFNAFLLNKTEEKSAKLKVRNWNDRL